MEFLIRMSSSFEHLNQYIGDKHTLMESGIYTKIKDVTVKHLIKVL